MDVECYFMGNNEYWNIFSKGKSIIVAKQDKKRNGSKSEYDILLKNAACNKTTMPAAINEKNKLTLLFYCRFSHKSIQYLKKLPEVMRGTEKFKVIPEAVLDYEVCLKTRMTKIFLL